MYYFSSIMYIVYVYVCCLRYHVESIKWYRILIRPVARGYLVVKLISARQKETLHTDRFIPTDSYRPLSTNTANKEENKGGGKSGM